MRSIHSANQLRHMGNRVGDTPKIYRGTQLVHTPCGSVIPLSICSGLQYMDMHTPTKDELESLLRVIMTADMAWRQEEINNEHAIPDENLDEETPDFGYGEINESGEVLHIVRFVNDEDLPDLNTTQVPYHQRNKKIPHPCREEKHTNALWGEVLEPCLKNSNMLGFDTTIQHQMYGEQFDVNEFDIFVDFCIIEAQKV